VGLLKVVPPGWRAGLRTAGERLLPRSVRKRLEQERREIAEARKAAEERHKAEEKARRAQERRAKRRSALLDSDSDLRWFSTDNTERIGRVVGGFTAAQAAAHNLAKVTTALASAGIDYFLIPCPSVMRHVVGVLQVHKQAALAALSANPELGALYAARPASQQAQTPALALCAEGALPKGVRSAGTIRFGEHLLGPALQVLAAMDYGCDVEFWMDGAELSSAANGAELLAKRKVMPPASLVSECWFAPRRNPVADVLPPEARKPATTQIAERAYATFAPFTRPGIEQVGFPIDAVYTWVDGSAPDMAAKRARHQGDAGTVLTGRAASRFIDREELRYALRSVEMYAPFIRHIYLVTDGQVPHWLDTSAEGITVVDHRDIFADPEALPVFNSHAIESQLHHIDGLAEHYLYVNDDMYFGGPVGPEQFFHGNGLARVPASPQLIGLGDPHNEEPAPSSAGKNVRRLLTEAFGRDIHEKYKHVPQPQLLSVMAEMEERFAAEWQSTMRSRFRSTSDIAVTATLHNAYARLTARAVPGEYRLRYVNIAFDDAQRHLDDLAAHRHYDFFCVNDVDTPVEIRERTDAMVRGFLEGYFPFPSRFEKPSA
jgi:hypothetical protein